MKVSIFPLIAATVIMGCGGSDDSNVKNHSLQGNWMLTTTGTTTYNGQTSAISPQSVKLLGDILPVSNEAAKSGFPIVYCKLAFSINSNLLSCTNPSTEVIETSAIITRYIIDSKITNIKVENFSGCDSCIIGSTISYSVSYIFTPGPPSNGIPSTINESFHFKRID